MYRDDRERAEKARKLLARVRVATPCPADWAGMVGDARVRHCALCEKKVFNFSEMSAIEVMELLAQNDSVCGRLYRRRDGTVITADCLVGRRKRRRKAALVAAGAAAIAGAAMIPSAPRPAFMSLVASARATAHTDEVVLDEPFELDEDTFLNGPPRTEPVELGLTEASLESIGTGLIAWHPDEAIVPEDSGRLVSYVGSATVLREAIPAPQHEGDAEQVEEPVDGVGAAVDDAASGELADEQ